MEHNRDARWRRERMAREAHDRRMYREEERMVRQIERGIARNVIHVFHGHLFHCNVRIFPLDTSK